MATRTSDASNGILNQGFSAGSNGKSVLKEAVDAVLKSFAKHTQGHGGGRSQLFCIILSLSSHTVYKAKQKTACENCTSLF